MGAVSTLFGASIEEWLTGGDETVMTNVERPVSYFTTMCLGRMIAIGKNKLRQYGTLVMVEVRSNRKL